MDRPTGPYAPIKNVREVLSRLRHRGLPSPLTTESLETIGVPSSSAPRTLQAIRFLGIVNEQGQLTETAEAVRRASTEEYPGLLAEMIRTAYLPVFQVVNPAEDTEVRVADAFRQYDPAGQRDKMVTLFLGLCEDAEIVQRSSDRPARTAQPRREPRPTVRGLPRKGAAIASHPPAPNQLNQMQPVNLLFGVTLDDIDTLPNDEFDTVWKALGLVAKRRAQARRATAEAAQRPQESPAADPEE